jgi:hypothetical protein
MPTFIMPTLSSLSCILSIYSFLWVCQWFPFALLFVVYSIVFLMCACPGPRQLLLHFDFSPSSQQQTHKSNPILSLLFWDTALGAGLCIVASNACFSHLQPHRCFHDNNLSYLIQMLQLCLLHFLLAYLVSIILCL